MTHPFYITTPIYYVNDVPHIGHAYTTIAADVVARYRRLVGNDVCFLTGLDEHGQKVQHAADQAGVPPQEYCDRLAPKFQTLWKKLHISHDAFIRTTDGAHTKIVQQHLHTLYERGFIYQAPYSGWYCTFDERFWTDKDVVDGLCPDCKRPVEHLSEHNYFFRMSQFQERLITHIHDHEGFIRPLSRRNEVLGFLHKPLEDLSISRPKTRLSWGIELPFDNDYVAYVWVDALVNYVSALTYLLPPSSFEKFWPATIHLVGKDILTTHAVYWSTMLMALELPLPKTIFAHGWWTMNGEKMSKSRGNVVDPSAMVDEFGVDAFRYFLLRDVPFGHDGDFSRDALIGRINSDLANGLGNLLHRTLTLIERCAQGTIPHPTSTAETDREWALQRTTVELLTEILPRYLGPESLEFNRALEAIWGVVQLGNQYIEKTAPWTLATRPEDRGILDTVLYHAAETLRLLSLALAPLLPQASKAIARQLGIADGDSLALRGPHANWGGLPPGTMIAKGDPLFPRLDRRPSAHTTPDLNAKGKTVLKDHQPNDHTNPQPSSPATTAQPSPGSSHQIAIQDFQNIELRTAKILTAERVPKSSKLLRLLVDLGTEQRQIVAGIGKKYDPEVLIGKTVVIVANLKPATLMGIESQGMVLAAGDHDVAGLVTIQEDIGPGMKVK